MGVEMHEDPDVENRGKRGRGLALEAGMVLALEPKFSFPGLGVVGVEDTFLVTETGVEKLTGASYEGTVEPLSSS